MSAVTEAPAEQDRPAPAKARALTPGQRRRRRARRRAVIAVAAGVVLLVVMVVSTNFKTAAQVRALNPPAFEASRYVQQSFAKITTDLTDEATPISELAPAVDTDAAAAGQQFGVDQGAGNFAFPVSATGTVESVDENFAVLAVPGVPDGDAVRVPIGTALNGTPVRDAAGLKFGDFPGQTDYQNVANELKLTMQDEVLAPADLASKQGQQVVVVGAFATGGPPNSFIIQPVSIEAGS